MQQNAGSEDIKQALRKLARKYHPEVAKDKIAGEMTFKESTVLSPNYYRLAPDACWTL